MKSSGFNCYLSLCFLLISAGAASAATQNPVAGVVTQFGARLDGAQVVPPSGSLNRGRAWAFFDSQYGTHIIRLEVSMAATAVDIHRGASGVNGPIEWSLYPVSSNEWAHTIFTPSDFPEWYKGNYYFIVKTAAFPSGELRGQIVPAYQRTFERGLSGSQVVPPSGSTATGTARGILHVPENILLYFVNVSGLSGPATGAGLFKGTSGSTGPLVLTLTGSGSNWSGDSILPLSATDISDLLAGNMYINITTAAFPLGEVRAQVSPSVENFVANIDTAQAGHHVFGDTEGLGQFSYDPATSVLSGVGTWGGTNGTTMKLYEGVVNAVGSFVVLFTGTTPGPFFLSIGLTPTNTEKLFRGQYYVDLATDGFPSGNAARGVLRLNPDVYGFPGPTAAPALGRVARIGSFGAPTQGNTNFTITLTGAVPFAYAALGLGDIQQGYHPLHLDSIGMPQHYLFTDIIDGFAMGSDANGSIEFTITVPVNPLLSGDDFHLQWVVFDPGANGQGVIVSDALCLLVQ